MTNIADPNLYRIRVEGILPKSWSASFAGMDIQHEGNTSLLTGVLPDQSALYGILNHLAGLNLTLIFLERLSRLNHEA